MYVYLHACMYTKSLKYKGIFTNKGMDYIDLCVSLYHSLNFIFQFNYGGMGWERGQTDIQTAFVCKFLWGPEGVSDYFKLELQEVMSHQMWVL